jgi:hypothetical protein
MPVVAGVIPWAICSDARESPWLSSGWAAVDGASPSAKRKKSPGFHNSADPGSCLDGRWLVRRAFMAPGLPA